MLPYTTEQLLKLNKIGLIPGPQESVEEFTRRADYCLHLKNHLSDELKTNLDAEIAPIDILEPATMTLSMKYDIAPHWIPLFFSNYRLPLWHGGCAWIYQMTEDSPTAALIQLRRKFEETKKYLGIYHRDELITHELCHVGRMKYQEPKYEEMLAYRTSEYSFRRLFGSLFQSSIESVIFLLIIFMLAVFDFFLISTDRHDAYTMALWLKAIPVALILAAITRLVHRRKTLEKCRKNLEAVFGKKYAEAVLYRLTDDEITRFSKYNSEHIKAYANTQAAQELRWRVITAAYPV